MNFLGSGWKMIAGSILLGAAGVMTQIPELAPWAQIAQSVGLALLGVGAAGKAERYVRATESQAGAAQSTAMAAQRTAGRQGI